MISLLKLLLAAAPACKPKTDSINILADVLPEEMPYVLLWLPGYSHLVLPAYLVQMFI